MPGKKVVQNNRPIQDGMLSKVRLELSVNQWSRLTSPLTLKAGLESIEALVICSFYSSLVEAACACGVKTDTFRKRLDALEAWAKVALVQRRPKLILTPDGQRLLPYASRACEAIREFNQETSAEQSRNLVLGSIRKPETNSLRHRNLPSGFHIDID